VGRELAGGDRWPQWYEGNPFRAEREASMRSAGGDAGGDTDAAGR
jgi:hypothetical protein